MDDIIGYAIALPVVIAACIILNTCGVDFPAPERRAPTTESRAGAAAKWLLKPRPIEEKKPSLLRRAIERVVD